ncbi:MAG TPA: hypothetical protein PKC28_04020 [Bdellovibrionales bacterium]|nr:hypothetical protein [Bdellovibrionales bacterium]
MKKSWTYLFGVLAIAVIATTACSKKGGGGGGGTTAVVVGATDCLNTQCSIDGSGNVGRGKWRGRFTVPATSRAAFVQYLQSRNYCYGHCQGIPNYFDLQVSLTDGYLPGEGKMKMVPGGYRSYRGSTRGIGWQNSTAYLNGGEGGFVMVRDQYSNGHNWHQMVYQNQMPNLEFKILTSFTDSTHRQMNAQVFFNGTLIGQGMMEGKVYASRASDTRYDDRFDLDEDESDYRW